MGWGDVQSHLIAVRKRKECSGGWTQGEINTVSPGISKSNYTFHTALVGERCVANSISEGGRGKIRNQANRAPGLFIEVGFWLSGKCLLVDYNWVSKEDPLWVSWHTGTGKRSGSTNQSSGKGLNYIYSSNENRLGKWASETERIEEGGGQPSKWTPRYECTKHQHFPPRREKTHTHQKKKQKQYPLPPTKQ